MEQEDDNEQSVDWTTFCPDPGNPNAAAEGLHRFVDHLLSSGIPEDTVYERLSALGLPTNYVSAVIAEVQRVRRQQPGGPDSRPVLLSGPYDFGRVFDNLHQQEVARWEKKRERKARHEKSQHLAKTEPDPAFDLGGDSYARVLSREGQRAERDARFIWVTAVCLVAAIVLVLVIMAR